MQRCRIESESWSLSALQPCEGEIERLQRVLRLQAGDQVDVYDGCGQVGQARLTADADGGMMRLILTEGPQSTYTTALPVRLYQAIPKSARMDWLVEKATELGAAAIVPILTERGVVRPDPDRAGNRVQRWRRIAAQAVRQCGLAGEPVIETPQTLEAALAETARLSIPGMYGALESDAISLQQALDQLPKGGPLALFIGPEGDFTPDESVRLRRAGMLPVTLGSRVLRVETAAIAALAILGDRMPSLYRRLCGPCQQGTDGVEKRMQQDGREH